MSNEILYILLPDFASHEMAYLMEAISSDEQQLKTNPKYVNRIVAPTPNSVYAIGGFKVIPDYTFNNMPDDFAALVLIGGFGWSTPIAEQVVPIVRKTVEKGKLSEPSVMRLHLWQSMVSSIRLNIPAMVWNS